MDSDDNPDALLVVLDRVPTPEERGLMVAAIRAALSTPQPAASAGVLDDGYWRWIAEHAHDDSMGNLHFRNGAAIRARAALAAQPQPQGEAIPPEIVARIWNIIGGGWDEKLDKDWGARGAEDRLDGIEDELRHLPSATLAQPAAAPVEEAEEQARIDAWDDFTGEHLTDGKGYAAASVWGRCRTAFEGKWPDAEAARKAAIEALATRPDGGEGE